MFSWLFGTQPIVKISYKDVEIEKTPLVSSSALHSKYYFLRWVNSELRQAGVLPLEISIKVLWSESKREVCDADFKDLEPLKVKNILSVYVEHTAESEAVMDKYILEEQISETFTQMLMQTTQETCQDRRPTLHSGPDKSPEFTSSSLPHLEETLRSAGATSEANALAKDFQALMSTNLRKLNEVSALAQQVADKFPAVARGLKSSDSNYLSDAIIQQKSSIESAHKAIDEARTSIHSMKDKLGVKLHYYEWAGGCRSSASCVGLGSSALVPVAVGTAMTSALNEGAPAAARSPFTSWLTSQKVKMHTVTKKGGFFGGSHVKIIPVVTYHFHFAALMSSGCISLASLGCLAGISYYRCRRVPRWHQLASAFTRMMKALDSHEEHWHSLCFPCDELLVLLAQVEQEQNKQSHHAVNTWKKILKITATLITSIDSYFVWLDLAGYVPSGVPLRSRLATARGPNRYDILQEKISLQSQEFKKSGSLFLRDETSDGGQAQIKDGSCKPLGGPEVLMIENVSGDPLASTDVAIIEIEKTQEPEKTPEMTLAK